jgi:hypothetical protein
MYCAIYMADPSAYAYNSKVDLLDAVTAKITLETINVNRIWFMMTVISRFSISTPNEADITLQTNTVMNTFLTTIFNERPNSNAKCYCKHPNSLWDHYCLPLNGITPCNKLSILIL